MKRIASISIAALMIAIACYGMTQFNSEVVLVENENDPCRPFTPCTNGECPTNCINELTPYEINGECYCLPVLLPF